MRPRLTLTLAAILIHAAPAARPQSSAPTIQVYARETVVDVTVTDAHGNPVHNLTQSDFTIKEDGKPQSIKSFREFGVATPSPDHPPRKLPPNVYTNLQPPPAAGALNIILLDGLNTAPPDATNPSQLALSTSIQLHVRQDAAKYLKSMPAGTRVAILGLAQNLRILQGISSDPALLSAAVDTMQMDLDGRASTRAEWCTQQDVRNRATLEALQQIASDLTPIKGKKNLIWFSAGFPTITDPAVNQQPTCNAARGPVLHGVEDQTAGLLRTYALLNAAQIAVYPIGARTPGLAIENPVGPGLVDPIAPKIYLRDVGWEEGSFESMAEATGGAAYYNSNDLAGLLAKAVDRGANYYTISYVPPGENYDNGHHSIKVEVDQPGLHLAYRQSYDAVDPATIRPTPGLTLAAYAPAAPIDMLSAMGRSMPTFTQLLFDVEVQPAPAPAPNSPAASTSQPVIGVLDPKLTGQPLTRYTFQYSVPASQIAFSADPSGVHHGALEFDLAAYDADGKLLTSLSQTVNMPLSDDRYRDFIKGSFRFPQQLDLPPSTLFLRIGVHDPTSNKIGTLELPITLPVTHPMPPK
jgi:VWFA-related protein